MAERSDCRPSSGIAGELAATPAALASAERGVRGDRRWLRRGGGRIGGHRGAAEPYRTRRCLRQGLSLDFSTNLLAAAPQLPMSAALRLVGLLDVPRGTSARASVATPCSHGHLRRLATNAGEKSRLVNLAASARIGCFGNRTERLLVTREVLRQRLDDAFQVPRAGHDAGGDHALRRYQVDSRRPPGAARRQSHPAAIQQRTRDRGPPPGRAHG